VALPAVSTNFEEAAGRFLTHEVKVTRKARLATKRGAEPSGEATVITDLRCSIQPRSSFERKGMLGRIPEMTHMMYCKGEDGNRQKLDIHHGYEVADQYGLVYRVVAEPEAYPDLETGGVHHLEVELQRVVV
jgi:hypothetical protein